MARAKRSAKLQRQHTFVVRLDLDPAVTATAARYVIGKLMTGWLAFGSYRFNVKKVAITHVKED